MDQTPPTEVIERTEAAAPEGGLAYDPQAIVPTLEVDTHLLAVEAYIEGLKDLIGEATRVRNFLRGRGEAPFRREEFDERLTRLSAMASRISK